MPNPSTAPNTPSTHAPSTIKPPSQAEAINVFWAMALNFSKPERMPFWAPLSIVTNSNIAPILISGASCGAFSADEARLSAKTSTIKHAMKPAKTAKSWVIEAILPAYSLSVFLYWAMNFEAVTPMPAIPKTTNRLIVERTIPSCPYPTLPKMLAQAMPAANTKSLPTAVPNTDQKAPLIMRLAK